MFPISVNLFHQTKLHDNTAQSSNSRERLCSLEILDFLKINTKALKILQCQ